MPLTSQSANRPASPQLQPILTITTSKNWVLPPRPKNAAKAKAKRKPARPSSPKPAKAVPSPKPTKAVPSVKPAKTAPSPNAAKPLLSPVARDTALPADIHSSIRAVDRENYHLKATLLSLIHDYKSLRALVLSVGSSSASLPAPGIYESLTTARKRLFNEIGDPMSELITDMSCLSYKSPPAHDSPSDMYSSDAFVESGAAIGTGADAPARDIDTSLFDFVNLDNDSLAAAVASHAAGDVIVDEIVDEEADDELDAASLSLSISASVSEADENMLMTSLTRSTTVSTNNLFLDKKPGALKFYDLPVYSEDDYAFLFEQIDPHSKMMSIIQEDNYNQVAEFLEEKLMSNDIEYYVDRNHNNPTVLL